MPVLAQRTPQQARAVATRDKLLDATIACLEDGGCAKTSTAAVARRAGVSQGALFKHFSVKNALLAAAVERLFGRLIADYQSAMAPVDVSTSGVRPALDALWHIFTRPSLRAVFELYIAARTDEDLRQHLAPVLARHQDNLHAEARRMFPLAAASNPRFVDAIDCVINALQGAALGLLTPTPDAVSAQLAYLEQLACKELVS